MEDERYRRGQIYTIRNIKDDTMIYVGSTIDSLSKRFYGHKIVCKSDISRITLYSHIIDNDWSDWYIELYEYYPCNNKKELDRREGEVIREIGTINKYIAGRTNKEWREDNKEKVLQNAKGYYKDNKEKVLQNAKGYYKDNKEKVLQNAKGYYEHNKEKVLEYKKEYRKKNIDKIKEKESEKVCCDICGAFSAKNHLTSISCLLK